MAPPIPAERGNATISPDRVLGSTDQEPSVQASRCGTGHEGLRKATVAMCLRSFHQFAVGAFGKTKMPLVGRPSRHNICSPTTRRAVPTVSKVGWQKIRRGAGPVESECGGRGRCVCSRSAPRNSVKGP